MKGFHQGSIKKALATAIITWMIFIVLILNAEAVAFREFSHTILSVCGICVAISVLFFSGSETVRILKKEVIEKRAAHWNKLVLTLFTAGSTLLFLIQSKFLTGIQETEGIMQDKLSVLGPSANVACRIQLIWILFYGSAIACFWANVNRMSAVITWLENEDHEGKSSNDLMKWIESFNPQEILHRAFRRSEKFLRLGVVVVMFILQEQRAGFFSGSSKDGQEGGLYNGVQNVGYYFIVLYVLLLLWDWVVFQKNFKTVNSSRKSRHKLIRQLSLFHVIGFFLSLSLILVTRFMETIINHIANSKPADIFSVDIYLVLVSIVTLVPIVSISLAFKDNVSS